MIDFVWAVICSKSIIDDQTKNISLIDVVEQINISRTVELPISIALPIEVVSLWSRTNLDQPARGHGRIVFITPSGNSQELGQMDIDLESYKRLRARIGLLGLPISELGKHVFEVHFSFEGSDETTIVARVPIEIVSEAASEQ